MPAPVAVGVYVLAAVGTVAATLAFKEFVYEPHIAPRVERWAEEFLAKREARRMRRAGGSAVAVPSSPGNGGDVGFGAGSGMDYAGDNKSTYELESLVANEVRQWRSQVDLTRGEGASGLRHRKTGSSTISALDESNIIIPYDAMTPTHVLFDPADGLSTCSPTSTMGSRVPTPSPASTLSHSAFRAPPPMQAPPTPEPSVHGSPFSSPFSSPVPDSPPQTAAAADVFVSRAAPSPTAFPAPDAAEDPFASPHHVPSLSLSHPLDLDAEDLEILSAPSSRPSSPFSEFSALSRGGAQEDEFHSFTLSPGPERTVLSASTSAAGSEAGDELDLERWSNAGSEVSGSESSWASMRGR
ncbi:hypothetical protein DFH06DRAFT_1305573 [Mycena polygramma]|nr:hypothetical protein DFH06DRAFT_1305573 [Mycena polygramma]